MEHWCNVQQTPLPRTTTTIPVCAAWEPGYDGDPRHLQSSPAMTYPEKDSNSVTRWLDDLKHGSDDAANELWRRYFKKLVAVARNRLANAPKRIADEEDVALNVFKSLCEGVEQGRFEQLNDRDDLWKLLVVMTRHKSTNQIRHQSAQKRGGRDVSGNSIFAATDGPGFDYFLGSDPTPEFLVQVQEEQERLLSLLTGNDHRNIAELRLQGYSVEETASQLGISQRSVKRKLALIREVWIVEIEEPEKA
jgi:RNA polymerase sigma factor (sigma-70 family)